MTCNLPVNCVTIGSGNVLLPSHTWANVEYLSVIPPATIFIEIWFKYQKFLQESVNKNVICKMSAIFSGLNMLAY